MQPAISSLRETKWNESIVLFHHMQMNNIRKQSHWVFVEAADFQLGGRIQQPTLQPVCGTKLDQLIVQMQSSFILLWPCQVSWPVKAIQNQYGSRTKMPIKTQIKNFKLLQLINLLESDGCLNQLHYVIFTFTSHRIVSSRMSMKNV